MEQRIISLESTGGQTKANFIFLGDAVWKWCICFFDKGGADTIDSVALTSIHLRRRKHVAEMRPAVIATHFVVIPDTHMGCLSRIVALGVGIPSTVMKLGCRRVERVLAGTAGEVSVLGEKLAEFAHARCFRSTTSQHPVFVLGELVAPLLVSLLERIPASVHGLSSRSV
jgi:hypothetical protein